MRVLLVKTSSMGDIIHALPAVTDAARAIPGIQFDWVVEEAFQEIPRWHPAVDCVIVIAQRRWRKVPIKAVRSGEWRNFREALRERTYDLVLDSQGLFKSAWVAALARGEAVGFDRRSMKESLAAGFYRRGLGVTRHQHAISRQRELFAKALGYDQPQCAPDSGLSLTWQPDQRSPYVVFLHGTSWPSKEWSERNWIALARLVRQEGFEVRLSWGNEAEWARAKRIADETGAMVLPRLNLDAMAHELAGATRVVGVDTGLAHLAAAIGVPAITLYGATDPALTGAVGPRQTNLVGQAACVPCQKRECRKRDNNGIQLCWSALSAHGIYLGLEL